MLVGAADYAGKAYAKHHPFVLSQSKEPASVKQSRGFQSWQVQDIEAGLAEAGRGEFATDAEVKAVFAKYGA